MKDRQHNGQKKKDKTLHGKQKTEQHEPQEENMDKHGCSGMMSSPCTISGTHRIILVKNPGISHERGNLVLTVRTRLYADAVGMLLHVKGKYTVRYLKSSLL